MHKIKVMIVDDHLVVREGLKQLLEMEDGIQVVGQASNALECFQFLEKTHPDVIFMDVRMPGISGIEATRLISQKYPHVRIIMLTIYEDAQYVNEAIYAGAKAYILKNVNRQDLIKIIRHVMEDHAFLDPSVTATIFNRLKRGNHIPVEKGETQLTQRELEILKEIVAGNKDREIAESLGISEYTVRSHIKSLYRKLGVSSRAKAVAKAINAKIIHQVAD